MNLFTETVLLQRIKLGDRGAAEKLIDAYYEQVYAFLFSFCKNKETAEDLTQETFIKVWNSLHGFSGASRASTWLYRIAYNTFIDWRRRQKTFYTLDERHDTPIDAVPFDDVAEKLFHNLRTLPEKQREVIVLHYQHDLTYGEIARILEIPQGTVKSRLNAALESLRRSEIVKEL
ncbi:hypothetical protein A2V82_01115 [candidate division KSB1 bacterium RBG_16_48_16]|nr:MAG: hypothetical protein A2V82_01115 [candidate division KSB1 bacterium RBG_16_48_16]